MKDHPKGLERFSPSAGHHGVGGRKRRVSALPSVCMMAKHKSKGSFPLLSTILASDKI